MSETIFHIRVKRTSTYTLCQIKIDGIGNEFAASQYSSNCETCKKVRDGELVLAPKVDEKVKRKRYQIEMERLAKIKEKERIKKEKAERKAYLEQQAEKRRQAVRDKAKEQRLKREAKKKAIEVEKLRVAKEFEKQKAERKENLIKEDARTKSKKVKQSLFDSIKHKFNL